MKLKNGVIYASSGVLNKLCSIDLPIKTMYTLKKNCLALNGTLEFIDERRKELLQKYIDVYKRQDVDTLYAVRRLSVWMGDVYVRNSSGSGYWANVKVKYNQKYNDLTIPIRLDVTRVEGGA